MQFFKGDAQELKFVNSVQPVMANRSTQKTTFFNQAYFCFKLGDVIADENLSPLARAIPREVFRESFPALFDAFVRGGTFEAYVEVFKAIFGQDVLVTFVVPGPGQLEIDITATGNDLFDLLWREIVDEEYILGELKDDEGDIIQAQVIKNFVTQYELEQTLFELVPAGIFTDIDLTIGS
jgi:hypothetical protein